jgi:pimeloyl-ACP methyl ester carboxylesterase
MRKSPTHISHRARETAFIFAVTATLVTLLGNSPSSAQSFKSLQVQAQPLSLKARGSFYVGGRIVEQTAAEILLGPDDSVTVDQMYVEYMIPTGRTKLPIVLIHGATLSGKSYDTTPDGRMGWFEYFVRKSHPTYVIDQVGRARSGFNQAPLNRRLAGTSTPAQTVAPTAPGAPAAMGSGAFRLGDRIGVWKNFRFGPRFGETFPNEQFPVEAVAELSKQAVPDLASQVPQPNPTLKALSDLAIDLNGAVLISHSQSGPFPMDAALINPAGIRGIVSLEPGACRANYTDAQIAQLAKAPSLVMFGDNLPVETGLGGITWQTRLEGCRAYAARIKAAGGQVDIVHTPELGIAGNSHMLMQDKNNLQIGDIILKWIDGVSRKKPA